VVLVLGLPDCEVLVRAAAVKKEEGTCAVQFGTPDRIEFHLDNWRRWMRSGREVDGHARQSQGLSDGGTSKGFDEMAEAEDRRCAKVVDAILDNLPPVQRIAIYIERGIMGRVFTFVRVTYHQALTEGKAALGRELARRGVW
jgi:hypothetical protein